MATLSGNKIKNTYQSLVKFSDNGNITVGAKQLTDGFGNNSPMFVSTTQVGIGVTPESGLNLHVFGDAKIGSNLTVIGNLVVEGSTTTVGTDTLTVKDPLIVLANNNTASDAVDIGFYGKYTPSGTTLYSGLFREALTGKYRLFKGLETEPTTTVNTSGTGYAQATLIASLEGNVTGNLTGNVTGGTISGTTGTFSGNVDIDGTLDVDDVISVEGSAFGRIEIGGASGGYIDLKAPNSDDYDLRIITSSGGNEVTTATGDLIFNTAETLALTIDTSQDATFEGDIILSGTVDGRDVATDGAKLDGIESGATADQTAAEIKTAYESNANTNAFTDADETKLDGIEASADVTDATNVLAAGAVMTTGNQSIGGVKTFSDQVTIPATPSASTDAASKGYVDAAVEGQDTLAEILAIGNTTGGTDIAITSGDKITNFTSTGIDDNATSEAIYITSGGKIGIDEDTPLAKLTVNQDSLVDTEGIMVQSGNDAGNGGVAIFKSANLVGSISALGSSSSLTFMTSGGTTALTLDSSQNATFAGDITLGGNILLNGGVLYKNSGSIEIKAENIRIKGVTTNENLAGFNENGSVQLYYDNVEKLATTSTGISVSGTSSTFAGNVTSTGLILATNSAPILEARSTSGTQNSSLILTNIATLVGASAEGLKLYYSGSTGNTFLDSYYSTGSINFRTKVSGTPITGLSISADGNSTFAGDVEIGNTVASSMDAGANNLVVGSGSGTEGMTIYSGTSNSGVIYFADGVSGDDRFRGQIGYSHSDNSFSFRTNASSSPNMVIDSSGNVGIGINDPLSKLHISGQSGTTGLPSLLLYGESPSTGQRYGFNVSADQLDISALGTNARIGFFTGGNASSITERMRIDSSGNVGIGTDSPSSDISGSVTMLEINDATNNNLASLALKAGTQGSKWEIAAQSSNALGFFDDGTERMRIDSSGNVGIGGSPSVKLDVVGSGKFQPGIAGGDALVTIAQTNTNAYVHAGIKINAGNTNPFYIYQSGSSNTLRFNYNSLADAGGQLVITDSGNVGIGTDSPDEKLDVQGNVLVGDYFKLGSSATYMGQLGLNRNVSTGAIYNSSYGAYQIQNYLGDLEFQIYNSSGNDVCTHRFFGSGDVFFDGDVGIKDTSPSYELDVDGTIRATGDVIAYSDKRVKENIKTIDNALNKVDKLRGVEFNKIGEDKKSIGVIAQEIEKVIPEVVREDDKGMKSVAYGNITGVLIEAIKELKSEIEILKNKPCVCNNCNCK